MARDDTHDIKHDLILPTVLFASLGAMSWAVRGCSGYGGSAGCLFAGVLWGTAWWFIAREPGPVQTRRYTSGWIILAMCVGFYIAGGRGWAQWWTLYEGRLQTNASKNEFVEIAPIYGYAWVFLSAVRWVTVDRRGAMDEMDRMDVMDESHNRNVVFPHAYTIVWVVLIIMNVLAQLVTSSPRHWTEVVFAVYYLLLFGVTGLIVHHYHVLHGKRRNTD